MKRKTKTLLYAAFCLVMTLAFVLSINVPSLAAEETEENPEEAVFCATFDYNGGVGRYWVDMDEINESIITATYPRYVCPLGEKFELSKQVLVRWVSDSYASPYRSGYSFKGWTVKGSDEIINAYTVTTEPVTFVAQWTLNADTYPKDSELTGTIDASKASKSITGTFTAQDEYHLYKMTVPTGKSIKMDINPTGKGIGNPVTLTPVGYGFGGDDDEGITVIKMEDDYPYIDAIRSYGIEYGTKRTLYLNEGNYYISITAHDHIAQKITDSDGNVKYINAYQPNVDNYLSYSYTINFNFTEVEDAAKGKANGNRFSDSVDINVGDTINGVVPLCSSGSANAEASLGNNWENYRFVLDKKATITMELSDYDKEARYTWIGFYKEGDTPYFASTVATNGRDVVEVYGEIDGVYIDEYTKSHSLTKELEPGTYFICFNIRRGLIQETYDGTTYKLTLKDESLSKDISTCKVSSISAKAYTGSAITPSITVKDGTTTLKKGTDYTVSYANNKNVGKATVTITGIGAYSGTINTSFLIKKATLKYRAYVQKKNWMSWQTANISGTKASGMAGTTDNLRMETIQMKLSGVKGKVEYRAYCSKKGWTQWATTADTTTYAGTKGESRRVELLQLRTSGEVATLYDIYFRAYSEKLGWLGWAKNGEKAGTQGYAYKLEAFQVNLVRKGEAFKITSDKTKSFYDKTKDETNPK